jgi:hypothetical protein
MKTAGFPRPERINQNGRVPRPFGCRDEACAYFALAYFKLAYFRLVYFRFEATKSQLTRFQNASTYFGRALR